MGPGARLRDLGDRPGLGSARADRERAVGKRAHAARQGDRARRRLVLLLLRGDRDRQVAVSEGRLGGDRARLPVRLDQPGLGAGAGALGADRLAVHPRRVHRRDRDDRADGADAAPVRLAAARGAGAQARPGGAGRPPPPAAPALGCRGVSDWPRPRPGPTSPTTSAATGRCCGRRSRSASCSPASSACSATTSSTPVHRGRSVAGDDDRERDRRPADRRAQLRLLGRQRAAGGGAVVGRDQLRRRDGVHLRRPDRDPDRARLPQVLRDRRSRCGSRR